MFFNPSNLWWGQQEMESETMDATKTEEQQEQEQADQLTTPETQPTEEETNDQEKIPMTNFNILTPIGESIQLNYVSLMENTSYLKQTLSEFYETCAYTSYNFEFKPEGQDSFFLSDFAELNAYFGESLGQTITLTMIPQLYDAKSSKIHVKRTRDILAYPPQVKGVATKKEDTKTEPQDETKEKSLEEMKADIERVKAALPSDGDIFTADSVSLKDYYQEVLYRVSENPDTAAQSSTSPADAIKSLFFSGWNPPPPPRKLRGDLFYLEVQFNVPNAPSLHITAQNSGFYINKSSTSTFDPSPAANPNFSHELLETLIASAPAISQGWAAVSKKIDQQTTKLNDQDDDIATTKANALESVAALYAQGRGDLVAQVPEWTSRPVEGNRRNKNLTYDLSRAQDDLCDNFGIEEKGTLREW
jgi:protein TIF31